MRLEEFDQRIRDLLSLATYAAADSSMNGLQVGRSGEELRRVAFAVDACLETIQRAAEWNAELLFVHHGLFWGAPLAVTGVHYRRLRALLEADCGLYAVHLPLDLHPQLGNNAGLARLLGLSELEPFGEYRGVRIGWKGRLAQSRSLEEITRLVAGGSAETPQVLPFGPEEIQSVGIVSGGAAAEALQAIDEGLDLFVTGDADHTVYHHCLEGRINVIFGGHYRTEVWGVKLLSEHVAREMGLETCFLDVPTGL
ncbi:MAG: Nif3-like dinuclear metal center hexameric protein [Spirochaetales bacterium]|nr:Nif3-like dinuclear metal center hexameric protein [Spirochaetales bacterium]